MMIYILYEHTKSVVHQLNIMFVDTTGQERGKSSVNKDLLSSRVRLVLENYNRFESRF